MDCLEVFFINHKFQISVFIGTWDQLLKTLMDALASFAQWIVRWPMD